MNELVIIAIGVIASDDSNVDLTVDIGQRLFLVWVTKKLGEVSLKRKKQAKIFATMRKSGKVGKTVVQMSCDQLRQR